MIFKEMMKKAKKGGFFKALKTEVKRRIAAFRRSFTMRSVKVQPNKIFFQAQENRYTCNPKYICEELRKRDLGLDIVWRVAKKNRGGVPEDVRVVTAGTQEYFKELWSSKYVILNGVLYNENPVRLKKDQIVIQTWHGALGIKRFGRKEYKSGWRWVKGAIYTGKVTDYCVSNSDFEDDVYRSTYWQKTPILQYGHPRNDIMFENYAEQRQEIRKNFLEKYDLPENANFILYGPTFRDSKNFDCYDIDVERVLQSARERFGGEWYFLLRYHMSLRKVYAEKNKLKDIDHVVDVTDYHDMQELITLADIAITDYSSWIYDFILQRKPGFIFATDIELYNTERGFCYPLESTPFPIATNSRRLANNIRKFDEKEYQEKLEAFLVDKGCVEDGHASERVVDKIQELMGQASAR